MPHTDAGTPLGAEPTPRDRLPAPGPASARPAEPDWPRQVLDGVADGITVQDADGHLIYANPAATRVLGYTSVQELLATPTREILARFEMLDAEGRPLTAADLPGRRAFQGEDEPEVLVCYRVRATGQEHWATVQARPVLDADGNVRQVVNTFRDVTERRGEEEALRFLDQASAVLAGSLDYEATLSQVTRIAVPVLADWCAVDIVDADGSLRRLGAAAADPADEALANNLRRQTSPEGARGSSVAAVVRDGRSRLLPTITAELIAEDIADAQIRSLVPALGLTSGMIVPLSARGQTLGALTFMTTRSRRHYGPRDLALAERLAERAGLAIDNARLYASAREHATRADALAGALRAIAEARLDEEAVLESIVHTAAEVIGDGAVLRLLSGDGQWLSAVASHHRDASARAALRVRLAATPMRRDQGLTGLVATSGRPVRIPRDQATLAESVEPEILAHYAAFGMESVLIVPLRAGGRVIGVLALARQGRERPYTAADQDFVQDLADIAALAIDNARLYDASGQARLRAEALAAASHAFTAASLDLPAVLETVTHRVAGLLGDGVVVRLLSDDGRERRAAASYHPDPERLDNVRRLLGVTPDGSARHDLFQQDRPLLFPELDPDWIRARIAPDYWPFLDRLGIRSLLAVPLRAHGRMIGTTITWRDQTPVPYGIDDQTFLQDLADRAALAIDNARLYDDAQRALRARETFLSIASHELKTPLTAVAGYTQLVRRQLERLSPAEPRLTELVAKLQRGVGRLDRLVQDLVDVSQLETGHLTLRREPADLSVLAEEVLGRFVDEARAEPGPGYRFSLVAPHPVVGTWDPARLEQVLANLVSNAVKYSPGGGDVRVTVRRSGDIAEVAVEDEGIGISAADQERLFEPFARGSGADAFKGTGLGLYVAREIVEQQGGTIDLESEPGRGSRFTVRLPIDAEEPSDPD
ncbi:MAG TPA: GAF domain-containing protein [Thermomicrobiaceae bacterium]|nr:GAF domain-containing protein [Thermomicrobiaceae bacterium]